MAPCVKLTSRTHAWNVDGSSSDKPPYGTSWIRHWEKQTGLVRSACAYDGCRRKATHGGHVWIKLRGVHLAPICAPCNSTRNADRMQHEKGRHSYLSAGTVVVHMRHTTEMQWSERRIACDARECEECGRDISNRPASHTVCLQCFRGRRCDTCGRSIDKQPRTHTLCLPCYRGE